MDQYYIFPSSLTPKTHSATRTQLGAEDTWDKAERKPNGLLLQILCYQPEAFILTHPAWIIQWLHPFSLGFGPQQQKEPYCCWFVSMQQLSGENGNIKNQLIYCSAKRKRSRLGLQWDYCYLQCVLKMQKTSEGWLLVWLLLISADGWLTGGSERQTKAVYDQHNQCDISTAT